MRTIPADRKRSKEKANSKSIVTRVNPLTVELSKKISRLSNVALEASDERNSIEFKYGIRQILNKKIERAQRNANIYIDSLKGNILYFINVCEEMEGNMFSWIDEKKIPSKRDGGMELDLILQRNKIELGTIANAKNSDLAKKYDSIYPVTAKIENLEWDYTYYYAYKDLIQLMYGILIANPEITTELFQYSPQQVIDEIKKYCALHTNTAIGNISVKPLT